MPWSARMTLVIFVIEIPLFLYVGWRGSGAVLRLWPELKPVLTWTLLGVGIWITAYPLLLFLGHTFRIARLQLEGGLLDWVPDLPLLDFSDLRRAGRPLSAYAGSCPTGCKGLFQTILARVARRGALAGFYRSRPGGPVCRRQSLSRHVRSTSTGKRASGRRTPGGPGRSTDRPHQRRPGRRQNRSNTSGGLHRCGESTGGRHRPVFGRPGHAGRRVYSGWCSGTRKDPVPLRSVCLSWGSRYLVGQRDDFRTA